MTNYARMQREARALKTRRMQYCMIEDRRREVQKRANLMPYTVDQVALVTEAVEFARAESLKPQAKGLFIGAYENYVDGKLDSAWVDHTGNWGNEFLAVARDGVVMMQRKG